MLLFATIVILYNDCLDVETLFDKECIDHV